METKICSRCKNELPLSEYYHQNNTKLKVYSSCKKCTIEARKSYPCNSPEENRKRAKRYKEKHPNVSRDYHENNKEKIHARHRARRDFLKKELGEKYYEPLREKSRQRRKVIRSMFFEMYGDKCACCGESNLGFLTMEHKNGLGVPAKERPPSSEEYKKAIKEYRPDLYEVLCYNCNMGSFKNNGICPHKI